MQEKIAKFIRNFYFISGFSFVLWMAFFDSEDLITHYKLRKRLKNLKAESAYYQEKIEEVKRDREELMSNEALLEKFAREKYYMKKKKEDVYVIVD